MFQHRPVDQYLPVVRLRAETGGLRRGRLEAPLALHLLGASLHLNGHRQRPTSKSTTTTIRPALRTRPRDT
ncbi:unnamed protein product, partial [Iphiclides podalirius]